jgi:hypothetical protein
MLLLSNEGISDADDASDDHSAYSNEMKPELDEDAIHKVTEEKLVFTYPCVRPESADDVFQGKGPSASVIPRRRRVMLIKKGMYTHHLSFFSF